MVISGKDKFDTNRIGSISESAITTRLLQLGYEVFLPYGRAARTDLLIENEEGQRWSIQCKTARINEDGTALTFNTANHNVTGKNRKWRNYRVQCDYFAVYYEKLNKVYLIPVDQVGTIRANLRLAPAKNSQEKYVRWAKDYEL